MISQKNQKHWFIYTKKPAKDMPELQACENQLFNKKRKFSMYGIDTESVHFQMRTNTQ